MNTKRIGALVSVASLFLLLVIVAHQGSVKAKPTENGFTNGADNPIHATSDETLVSCPFNSMGGDDALSRGFYVQSYPGTNLGEVQLTYWTTVAGSYTISLTARDGTYDGAIIGTTQVVTVDLPATTYITKTFDFGGASVISGNTVTFSQAKISGSGSVYYNTGPCGFDLDCTTCSGVYQTSGTSPPLDFIRRRSVAVTISQVEQLWVYLPLVIK